MQLTAYSTQRWQFNSNMGLPCLGIRCLSKTPWWYTIYVDNAEQRLLDAARTVPAAVAIMFELQLSANHPGA
jgi:hypothetical protein